VTSFSFFPRAMSARARSAIIPKPIAATVPPGKCVFGDSWTKTALKEKKNISHDTRLLTFALDSEDKPLNLSTCACILARADDDAGNQVIRPYTPITPNSVKGTFDLILKVYPQGVMSQHFDKMKIGDSVEFKHIEKNVKIQYPFNKKHIGVLVGGTGVAPVIQALHAILGTSTDVTKVSLLFGNRTEEDILLRGTLDAWACMHKDRFTVTHVLSEEKEGTAWNGERGFITKDLIKKHCPAPASDSMIFVCGPPPMYTALCGPREEAKVTGALATLGYDESHVFKF